jgi:hypothetical protein
MVTACFIFGRIRGARTRRAAYLGAGVLLWSGLEACAQFIGIEIYEEHEVLGNDPGSLGGAGSSTLVTGDIEAAVDSGLPDAGGAPGTAGGNGASAGSVGSGGAPSRGGDGPDRGGDAGDGGDSAGSGGTTSGGGDGGTTSGSSGDGGDGGTTSGSSGDGGEASAGADAGGGGGDGGSGGAPLGCTPDAERCTDNAIEICTDIGEWEPIEPCIDTTCDVTGDDAECVGECAPGQVTCQDGDAFECDRGEWDLADACDSAEVCRAGECVAAHRDVGNATVLNDVVFQPEDTLLLYRLPVLAHDAVLEYFGIVGDADDVQARLVLYGDRADGLAPTGGVIAQTGGLSFGLTAGVIVTAAPASPDTVLSAGTAYWLGVVTSKATTLRAAPGASTAMRIVPFAPFNAPFGPAQTGQVGTQDHLNVFIGVRELP